MNCPGYRASKMMMMMMIMIMTNGTVLAYFKVLSQNFPGWTNENYTKSQ
jgi:hypothetical protein